jgi:NAD(P)-dependent dehydrogenase (short-subunit alcohol dehydrogenase family)
MELRDKVALITGAGSGLGLSTAKAFAREGAKVVVNDLREDAARAAADLGPDHSAVAGDVSKETDVATMVSAAVGRFGRIDILVNDAGVPDSFVPTVEQPLPHWQRLIDIHLTGTYLVSKTVAPHTIREVRERLRPLGVTPTVGTVDEFPANFAAENAKWREVIRSRNIRVQ